MLMPLEKFASFWFITLILFLSTGNTIAQKTDHASGELIVMLNQGMVVHELITQFAEFNNQVTGLTVLQQLSARLNIWLLHFDATSVNE